MEIKRGPGRPRKITPIDNSIAVSELNEARRACGWGKKGKIAIVGCYPGSWESAPYNDLNWEIWGFSRRNMGLLPRVDKWFELHQPANFERYENEVPGYGNWLNQPFAVLQKDFPKDALEAEFGKFFFGSGQAPWLMAYAITMKPDAIGLWGIEALDNCYRRQRHEIQHFAQVARDRGIDLVIPEGCTILTPSKSYL